MEINDILAATVFDCYNVYLTVWEECTVLCSLCMHIHVHKVYMDCRYMYRHQVVCDECTCMYVNMLIR